MDKNNVELSSIIPFKEDENGKHTVIIPKAAIPSAQGSLPIIKSSSYNEYLFEHPYMISDYPMSLYRDEIEKKLRYKVKIVNKENKND